MAHKPKHFIITEHILALAIAIALSYWILEAATQAFILKTGNFWAELLSLGSHKIWHRTLVTGLFILFGMYARMVIKAQQRTQKSLKKAQSESQRYNRELVAKNKELESVIFVASHDMRSTILNIQGFSKELGITSDLVRSILEHVELPTDIKQRLQNPLESEIPRYLEVITKSTSQIDTLLNGLLHVTRIARDEMKPANLNINEIVRVVLFKHDKQIKDANIRVEVGILPGCAGDPNQMAMVFSNLIDNAIKYLDKSRPGIIKIFGHTEQNQVIYCIEDNGIGIAPEHQKKIFEIFHRLDPSEIPGEGLGLTIARLILDRHDGKIWVESAEGEGSKFFLSLHKV